MKIVYQNQKGGLSVIYPTGELSIEEVAAKDVPNGASYAIVEDAAIPSDRTFRDAWKMGNGTVNIDLPKAKAIAHDMRRANRAAEFAPYDDIIAKQIPGMDATAAEAARQVIRDKYVEMQDAIDDADSPTAIKAALGFD